MLRKLNEDVGGRIKSLKFNHLVPMFKPAWEHAFTKERNLQGWVKEGIIPFTRRQLWELHEQKLAASALSLPPTTNSIPESTPTTGRVSDCRLVNQLG